MDILDLALALIFAKLFAELFVRMKQMGVLGELVTGIIFAVIMTYVPMIKLSYFGHTFSYKVTLTGEAFDFFADMGIILLLFIAGYETNIGDIAKSGKRGLSTASLGVTLPFILGAFFSHKALGFSIRQALVAGSIFTATSVGVTVRALMDLKKLRSPSGTTIITAAVIDDILGIIILTLVLGEESVVTVFIGFFILIAVLFILALGPVEKMMEVVHEKFHSPFALLSISIAFGLLISVFAREVGLAPITGAYFAGLLIGRTKEKRLVAEPIQKIARAVFIPIFFVKVGTLFDFRMFTKIDLLYFLFIPLAFIGKFIGCGLGSLFGGLKIRDALKVGIGMMPEMEVALVIVTYAATRNVFPGLISSQMVSVTILYVVLSAVVVPIVLKLLYPEENADKKF